MTMMWRRLTLPAAWLGVLAGEASLVPSMLPRQAWVQGICTGVVIANTYALALFITRIGRPLWARPARVIAEWLTAHGGARRGVVTLAWTVAAVGGLVAFVLAQSASTRLALATGVGVEPWYSQPLTAALAVLVAGFWLLLGRSIRWCGHTVGAWLRSARPRNRIIALATVVAAVVTLAAVKPVPAPADDSVTLARLASVGRRPQARSGGPGSAVSWTTLSRKGQQFVAGGPDAAQIAQVTGQAAMDPVRVYVGKDSAPTLAGRVTMAIAEMRRTHAFDRAAIVVAVPTGSGWVNPAAPAAAEYLYGGDIATVSVQYSTVPSWREYLQGLSQVEATSKTLLRAVNRVVDQLPSDNRPRVLMYGESLGALGALLALTSSTPGLHTDGQLWAGVPAQAPPAAAGVDQRRLVHADDPVAAWTPKLLFGPTPQRPDHWLPVVTFWAATADMVAAYAIPDGHGHRYGQEFVDAWHRLAPAIGVPGAAPLDRLVGIRSAIPLQ